MRKLNIDELSDKYNLSHETVKEEIETVISGILTKRFGFEVEAYFHSKPGSFEICGYREMKGDMELVSIRPEEIRKPLMREILHRIANALTIRSVLNDYGLHKHMIHTVVQGEIMRVAPSGLYVAIRDMEDISGKQGVVAVCERASQTPRERELYAAGMSLPFHVLNVRPVLFQGIPRLEMTLSRNSKGLPEGMLRRELFRANTDIMVKCTSRIAGAFSEMKTSGKIPKECIKKVSDELQERIIVRYQNASLQ